ncbi:MAG: hypothetical protein KF688_00800 [Pirellulales bacterium]|nr:hypothetical protein [Pirellulales bacterium]
MNATSSFVVGSLLVAVMAGPAAAQYGWGYRYGYGFRHGTVLGDAYSGASELVYARGQFLKDEADAAKTWVEVARAREALYYEAAEWRQQTIESRAQAVLARAEARRARTAEESRQRYAEARNLARDIRDGMPVWPEALRRPEYAASMTMIESIVQHWNPNGNAFDAAYRSALATELGVLENRVAANEAIDFRDRVAAVRTLRLLRELTAAGDATANRELAMR